MMSSPIIRSKLARKRSCGRWRQTPRVEVLENRALLSNLVTNGSFETPTVLSFGGGNPNGIEVRAPANLGGWVLDRNSVDLTSGVYQAAQGVQSLFLSGGTAGSVYQDIATIPGITYRLRFAMAGDPGQPPRWPAIKHMEARWGSDVVDVTTFDVTGRTTGDMGWAYHEYTVTATETTTRLRFSSLDFDPTGPAVDDVSLVEVQVPNVSVENPRWVPLSEYSEDASIVRIDYSSANYSGPVTLRLYAADQLTQAFVSSLMFDVVDGKSGTAEFRIRDGLSAGPFVPDSLVIKIDPVPDEPTSSQADNAAPLLASEPGRLSFELQTSAPFASTRQDRVELWLRRYRDKINFEAAHRRIDARAIAGAIAWEALNNVKWTEPDITSVRAFGPGKVHVTDSVAEMLLHPERPGSGVAQQAEVHYADLPELTIAQRSEKLSDPNGSIEYIAAIMGAFADIAEDEYKQAGKTLSPDTLRYNPALLATFYQGVTPDGYRTDLDLNTAKKFFQRTARSASYQFRTRTDPVHFIDAYINVPANYEFLTRALA